MKDKNWYLLDSVLTINNTFSYIEEIDHNSEIKAFIVGLFELTDEFNCKNKQPDKEKMKVHLIEVKKYICDNAGTNYKLARDIQVEIVNLDSDLTQETDYYQDLLKLRAAVKFDEE